MKKDNNSKLRLRVKAFFEKMGKGFASLKDKINPRTAAAVCAVFLVALALVLNFILFNETNVTGDDGGKQMAIDLNGLSDEDLADENSNVSADAEGDSEDDYFATVSLGKQQARDEAMEVLLELSENAEAEEDVKAAALADINRMALEIEKEGAIESMVTAKGFEKCVAVINGDTANVIVSSDTLTPGETAQISEIVYEAAGIVPANLKIIEKSIEG